MPIRILCGRLNEEIMFKKKQQQKKHKQHKLPKESSGKSVCGTFLPIFRNSSIDHIIRYAWSGFFSPYFYLLPWSISFFTFKPPLLCSLSLSASRFLHTFSRQGRPRCLLNWKPELAAAASPSQRNTKIKLKKNISACSLTFRSSPSFISSHQIGDWSDSRTRKHAQMCGDHRAAFS